MSKSWTPEELAAAKAEAADWQDKYVRLHAEWDTYRRRMAEQREAEKVRATEKLMESLIPVLDDFARTVDYAETNGETGLLGGVKAVQTKLSDTWTIRAFPMKRSRRFTNPDTKWVPRSSGLPW